MKQEDDECVAIGCELKEDVDEVVMAGTMMGGGSKTESSSPDTTMETEAPEYIGPAIGKCCIYRGIRYGIDKEIR